MSGEYRPIDCGVYSGYELAIMHRQALRVHWRDEVGADHLAVLQPRDLQTRQGEEYMLAVDTEGRELALRLDRILSATPLEGETP